MKPARGANNRAKITRIVYPIHGHKIAFLLFFQLFDIKRFLFDNGDDALWLYCVGQTFQAFLRDIFNGNVGAPELCY